jgi:hypothetical protein
MAGETVVRIGGVCADEDDGLIRGVEVHPLYDQGIADGYDIDTVSLVSPGWKITMSPSLIFSSIMLSPAYGL